MNEMLADRLELDQLVMTANKQSYLADARNRLKAGVAAIQQGLNGVASTTAATPAIGDDPSGIVNRSPTETTTNNNYPVRSDAPWVALIALLVIAGLALAWMWMASQPKPATPPPPTTTTPPNPGPPVVTNPPTSKTDPNYIEFYKP